MSSKGYVEPLNLNTDTVIHMVNNLDEPMAMKEYIKEPLLVIDTRVLDEETFKKVENRLELEYANNPKTDDYGNNISMAEHLNREPVVLVEKLNNGEVKYDTMNENHFTQYIGYDQNLQHTIDTVEMELRGIDKQYLQPVVDPTVTKMLETDWLADNEGLINLELDNGDKFIKRPDEPAFFAFEDFGGETNVTMVKAYNDGSPVGYIEAMELGKNEPTSWDKYSEQGNEIIKELDKEMNEKLYESEGFTDIRTMKEYGELKNEKLEELRNEQFDGKSEYQIEKESIEVMKEGYSEYLKEKLVTDMVEESSRDKGSYIGKEELDDAYAENDFRNRAEVSDDLEIEF